MVVDYDHARKGVCVCVYRGVDGREREKGRTELVR